VPVSSEYFFGSVAASSTAKTSFAGVSVQSNVVLSNEGTSGTVSTEAIAQGGSGPSSINPGVDFAAISTASPDKAYATAVIGDASNVANALLGPDDKIFGTANLDGGSSTFDFSFRGDLILGVVGGEADITVNGVELSAVDGFGEDTVIDLYSLGSNIDLTISGEGTFVLGGAVPEPSTWAVMLVGCAGLGLVGYRRTRAAIPRAA
jgi:hypothetical protein